MRFDLIIRQARVVDGSGQPAYTADIAVDGSRIARVGVPAGAEAAREIDAAGLAVCPGFIDAHSHADLTLVAGSAEGEKLRMGVTTEVIGQCGFSAHPLSDAHGPQRATSMAGFLPGATLAWDWKDLQQFRRRACAAGLPNNVVPLVGHGSVRMAVMGHRPDAPTAVELERMRAYVRTAMQQGAFGLSSGLIYPPAYFAQTEELTALACDAAQLGGLYVTHMRGETAALIDNALDEALAVAAAAGAPLQISHLKVIGLGSAHQGRVQGILNRVATAGDSGVNVRFDCYPYTRGSTLLSALMPPWALQEGAEGLLRLLCDPPQRARIRRSIEDDRATWENWIQACGYPAIRIAAVGHGGPADLAGLSLAEIADDRREAPFETLADILLQTHASAVMVFDMLTEADMLAALTHPLGMVGTDAIPCPPGQGHPHPRGYGTFPEILGTYVRDRGLLTLESAVRKMTALPAARFGLVDRGLIGEGAFADIVIFDPTRITAHATYAHPRRLPEGIAWVLVNGVPAIADGQPTGATAGQFLLKRI